MAGIPREGAGAVAMKKWTAVLAFFAMAALRCVASPVADTMTGIFDENVRTLQVRLDGDDFALPIVSLHGTERIKVSFDCLSDEREYFRYSIEHCTAGWQPSGLVDSEFIDGFNEGIVEDYEFSNALTVNYVHYSFYIPNSDFKPKISGNYLLRVYRENDPDCTVLQCRFMVSEESAPVAVSASAQTDVDYNSTHQQLSVLVDVERAGVEDPFNDLLIVAGQNGRLDSEVSLRQPLRVQGTKVIYEHRPELIFEAGNEYRRMEIVSDKYPGMGVAEIVYSHPYYHYRLFTDESRCDDSYSYDQTQHGRYFVREYNSDSPDVDADYGVVHFTLDYPATPGAMIFLDGDFVQRRFDDNSRMAYNPATGLYERSLLLKQGAYNYQYLVVPPGARRGYT
ncbi:MAG: DUF5103 domain-containing protein, partial [Muribaculaceae bacterium]|nr:DUF5103 domain-containing protein [Muribaculaceae bacterium]